jgi:hypothetical protein
MYTDQHNVFTKVISPAGSLSGVFDTEGWELAGLIITPTTGTLTSGNLQFRVGVTSTTLYPLNDTAGTRVGYTFGSAAVAYKCTDIVQAIATYRYWQVETSVAQVNGASIHVPVKL